MMSRTSGFSLIELVAVLVIIGALAVFAAPRLNIGGFQRYSFHEELLAAARHAQKTAAASRCRVSFSVDAGTDSYSANFPGGGSGPCSSSGPLQSPGQGGTLSGQAPGSVDVTTGASVTFDEFGVPDTAATITLTGGRQVVIEAFTGYVHP